MRLHLSIFLQGHFKVLVKSKTYKTLSMFWVPASLELDNLMFPHESSRHRPRHLLLLAMLRLRRSAGQRPLEPSSQPRAPPGFRVNPGGQRAAQLFSGPFTQCYERHGLWFSKLHLCPVAVPAKAPTSETESMKCTP